ncbi:hypothetical protein [Marmoricola sp. RAF53]|uniref:hypothetical protein n=1 Tax=Marmoricola sp. RAF53 TaxID=3233059 RepID=UPI003F9B63F8
MFFLRRPRPRPLSSYVVRVLVPRTVLFSTVAGALLVGQVMAVDPLAAPADSEPVRVPSWTAGDAAAHPGCVASRDWPEGRPADAVVVHSFRDGVRERMDFDVAWARNHDASESDDVWVVGVCP